MTFDSKGVPSEAVVPFGAGTGVVTDDQVALAGAICAIDARAAFLKQGIANVDVYGPMGKVK